MYIQASNAFRAEQRYKDSGDAAVRAAECALKANEPHDASNHFWTASKAYKRTHPERRSPPRTIKLTWPVAVTALRRTIELLVKQGRFSQAADRQSALAIAASCLTSRRGHCPDHAAGRLGARSDLRGVAAGGRVVRVGRQDGVRRRTVRSQLNITAQRQLAGEKLPTLPPPISGSTTRRSPCTTRSSRRACRAAWPSTRSRTTSSSRVSATCASRSVGGILGCADVPGYGRRTESDRRLCRP